MSAPGARIAFSPRAAVAGARQGGRPRADRGVAARRFPAVVGAHPATSVAMLLLESRGLGSAVASASRSFRAPMARESLSLCVAKEKVTQEKGHPVWRFPGIPARKVREPGAGFSTAHPCAGEKASTSCRCPLCGLSPPSHRRTGAPGRAPRILRALLEKPDRKPTQFGCDAFAAAVRAPTECEPGRLAALPGPLCGGVAWPIGPQGNRHDADYFSPAHGCAVEKPGHAARTFRPWMGGKRQVGWPLFGLLFSGQAEKSDSRAIGARKLLLADATAEPRPRTATRKIATRVAPTQSRGSHTRWPPVGIAPMPPGVGPRQGAGS